MNSKLLTFVLSLVVALALLCSCTGGGSTNKPSSGTDQNVEQDTDKNQNDDNQYDDVANLIFGGKVIPGVVCNDSETLSQAVSYLQQAVFYTTYYTPVVTSDLVDVV